MLRIVEVADRQRSALERHPMEQKKHPVWLVDLLIAGIAGALLLATWQFGLKIGRPAPRGAGSFFVGVYIVYLGLLFLLSYFFPGRSYVLSFLGFVCQECSRPAGRAMALFYFALSVIFGSALVLRGLGML